MVDTFLSQILYAMSGFFFAIFSVRFGLKSANRLKEAWYAHGLSLSFLLSALPAVFFLLIAVFVFPLWLYSRTPMGGFVYLATYIFFNMKR